MVWQKCKVLEVRYNKPYTDSHLINPIISLGLYALCITLNKTNVVLEIPCWSNFIRKSIFKVPTPLVYTCKLGYQLWQNHLNYPGSSALAITIKATPTQHTLQTEQFLVCRVTSRYNHRISDRTSIPRTKVSPEILQPQILQHRHNSYYSKF